MKKLLFIILFTIAIWALGLFNIPFPYFSSYSINLQILGVLLVASVLGPLGVISVTIFVLLTALGFPLLYGGRGGITLFFGPYSGTLYGYIICAILIGIFCKKFWLSINFLLFVIINSFGLLVLYTVEVSWFMYFTKLELLPTIQTKLYFLSQDLIAVILSSTLALLFKTFYPLIDLYIFDSESNQKVNLNTKFD